MGLPDLALEAALARGQLRAGAQAALLSLGILGCSRPLAGYDLAAPSAVHELPDELAEVSALTDLDGTTVACLQDELGAVFHVDVVSGGVVEQHPFGPEGDYEGLTRVDDALWVLRSDGQLSALREVDGALTVVEEVRLDLEHGNLEGLCYDPFGEVLLVAAKDAPKGAKDRRRVFSVDPRDPTGEPRLVHSFSLAELIEAAEASGVQLPRRTTRKGKEKVALALRFSSIAVHPVTGELFLLSGVDRALVVIRREGTLVGMVFLDADLLPKPEGITFLPGGELVLASEGAGGPARLLSFRQASRP